MHEACVVACRRLIVQMDSAEWWLLIRPSHPQTHHAHTTDLLTASASKPSHVNKSSSSSDDDDSYGIRSLCSCSSGAALSSLPSNSDVSSQGEGSSTEQTMQLAPGLHFAAAELRVKRALVAVCAGADVVFHLASAGVLRKVVLFMRCWTITSATSSKK